MRHALALLVLLAAWPARAELIRFTDLYSPLRVHDTVSGLTWRSTDTVHGTYPAALELASAGHWRHATYSEVCGLIEQIGFSCSGPVTTQSPLTPEAYSRFQLLARLLDANFTDHEGLVALTAIFAPSVDPTRPGFFRAYIDMPGLTREGPETYGFTIDPAGASMATRSYHFTVLVPEPSTALLVAAGLVAISAARPRR